MPREAIRRFLHGVVIAAPDYRAGVHAGFVIGERDRAEPIGYRGAFLLAYPRSGWGAVASTTACSSSGVNREIRVSGRRRKFTPTSSRRTASPPVILPYGVRVANRTVRLDREPRSGTVEVYDVMPDVGLP